MTAKECYESVMKVRNDKTRLLRETIFTGIQDAVKADELSYYHNGYLPAELKDELQDAGFKVTEGSQYNESYTTISWADAN